MNEKWFALSTNEIEKKLKTNATMGLTPKVARSRCNRTEKPFFSVRKKSIGKLILDLLSDFFLVMLLLVSCLSLFFDGDHLIGIAMLVLLLVNLGLSFWIYYKDKRATESLSDFFMPTARVIRGGKLYIADYRDVVVGDVILVERGDILGCDARLVYSDSLSVDMMLDKTRHKELKKYAGGSVDQNELYAENMSNMIHAGSRVISGSGRAIVVGTGIYTYLGALTGGFAELPSRDMPSGLVSFNKKLSKLGLWLLLLILPFTIFSILFGNFTGGTVLLSEVLSVALSLCAAMMLSRFSNLFCGFFVYFMRGSALSENPCIVRSVKAFDDLCGMDCLFLLDGSITTDGILHFNRLVTSEGEANSFDYTTKSTDALCDMIALYASARKNSPAMGVNANSKYDLGIDELLKKSRTDTEALKIRCSVQSYISMFDRSARDCLIYTDKGERRELHVCFEASALNECTHLMTSGEFKAIDDSGRAELKKRYESYVFTGKKVILFILKTENKISYAGMLVLREGIDNSIVKASAELQKNGVRIIAFTNSKGNEDAPELPDTLRRGKRADAREFELRSLPATYGFGEYDEYFGFDEKAIAEIVSFAKKKYKKIAVIGFSAYAQAAIENADVFITCAPIRTGVFGHFAEEIRSMEIPGHESSASCTQDVKAEADVLLSRPKDGRGGLEPLARVMEYGKNAYANLKNYLLYLLSVGIMRTVAVIFPMLFGNSTADARQLIFLGFVFDILVMMIFMSDARRKADSFEKVRGFFTENSLKNFATKHSRLLLCTLIGSVLTLLLPNLFGLIGGVLGNYVYKAEFTFMALALMQFAALFCIYSRSPRNIKSHLYLVKSILFIILASAVVLFTALCLITPIGTFFGIVRNPLFYFLLSFVPAIAFVTFWIVFEEIAAKKAKKQEIGK